MEAFTGPVPFSGFQRETNDQCPPNTPPGCPRSLAVSPPHPAICGEWCNMLFPPGTVHSSSLSEWPHHRSGEPELVFPSLQRSPPSPWPPFLSLTQTSAAATTQVCLLPWQRKHLPLVTMAMSYSHGAHKVYTETALLVCLVVTFVCTLYVHTDFSSSTDLSWDMQFLIL